MNKEELIKELDENTKRQEQLLKDFEKINKLKVDAIINSGIDTTKAEKVKDFVELHRGYNNNSGKVYELNNKMLELYKKINERIFYRRVIIDNCFPENSDTISGYYRSLSNEKMGWTSHGFGVVVPTDYDYRTGKYRNVRVSSIDRIEEIIPIFKKHKGIIRNPPITDNKLEIYQKLFDFVIQYEIIHRDSDIYIKLDKPIKVPIPRYRADKGRQYNGGDAEMNKICETFFRSLIFKDITSICITRNSWESEITIYNGSDCLYQYNISRTDEDNAVRIYHNMIFNYIPDEKIKLLMDMIDKAKKAYDNNLLIYEKMLDELGYLLLIQKI